MGEHTTNVIIEVCYRPPNVNVGLAEIEWAATVIIEGGGLTTQKLTGTALQEQLKGKNV